MARVTTDIDIDFADRDSALAGLMHTPASNSAFGRHPTGVYFQNIPEDPITGYAAIDFERAPEFGYFKIDFLNNSIYEGVRNEDHLIELINREPEWDMLEHREIVSMLAQIADHFNIVKLVKPKSVEDLAVVLALIRPSARKLLGASRAEIDKEIWELHKHHGDAYKRPHAIAYAVSIVVQLNLLCEQTSAALDAGTFNVEF